jgi:hypothetical protein
MNKLLFGAIVIVVSALFPPASSSVWAADAESHPKLGNRFYLDVGGYWPSMKTSISVDGALGKNPAVSLEDDLSFDERPALPYALMNVRLGERWRLELEGFKIGRDSNRTIDRVISIGDTDFPIGATLASRFDTAVYRMSGGYSFVRQGNSEAGVAFGLHATKFDFGVSETVGGRVAVSDALAPLPTLGVYGYHALSPTWLLFGRADVFSLTYDRYHGSLINLNVGAEYRVVKWLGLGFGYRHVRLDLKAKADGPVTAAEWVGEFDYRYSGPTLYMSVGL